MPTPNILETLSDVAQLLQLISKIFFWWELDA
jgi:hypothetical protein